MIGDFLGYALSLRGSSGFPSADELDVLFSPDGKGMRLPDTFAAYRIREPDDVPAELGYRAEKELGRKELWALTALRFGKPPLSALLDGDELRSLLKNGAAARDRYLERNPQS